MKKTIKVYSKICLSCHDEKWVETRSRLMRDFNVKEYRTALNPAWHKVATKLAGSDDYAPFVKFPDGATKAVKEVENGKEEKVSQVRRNETTKPIRKARVARAKGKTSKKVEKVK